MNDVIYIGDRRDARACGDAGIPSSAPPRGLLAERIIAERRRCRVLAMTADTFAALPTPLARELRDGSWPQVTIVADMPTECDRARVRDLIHSCLAAMPAARA